MPYLSASAVVIHYEEALYLSVCTFTFNTEGLKADSGDGVLGEGAATALPPARESGGALWGGDRAEPRPPEGFPLFSAFVMASPDTIISLIVDYHAAIGSNIDAKKRSIKRNK